MIEETLTVENILTIFRVSLIFSYLVNIIIFPIITWIFKSNKTDWGKFWQVWFFSALISGIIVIFLISAPNFTFDIINKLKEFLA